MKKLKVIFVLLTIVFVLTSCNSTRNSVSPKNVLKNNSEADFFVMKNVVYVNATGVEWVKELTLKEESSLGKIKRTGIKSFFTNWSATKLETNTEIFSVKHRDDIVLAKVENRFIPYLKYVEG